MDAGLQIKELARMLGVTEDSVINWEKRGITPTKKHRESVLSVLADGGKSLNPGNFKL